MPRVIHSDELYRACRDGDLAQLRRWRAQDPKLDLNRPMSSMSTRWYALEIAAANGQLEVFQWLFIEAGCSLTASEPDNRVIQHAANYGHLEILQWFMSNHSAPADICERFCQALRYATEQGHLDVVKWLVAESQQRVAIVNDEYDLAYVALNADASEVFRWVILESDAAMQRNPAWRNESLRPRDVTESGNNLLMFLMMLDRLADAEWLLFQSGWFRRILQETTTNAAVNVWCNWLTDELATKIDQAACIDAWLLQHALDSTDFPGCLQSELCYLAVADKLVASPDDFRALCRPGAASQKLRTRL